MPTSILVEEPAQPAPLRPSPLLERRPRHPSQKWFGLVSVIGFFIYLVPMFVGLHRGQTPGQREGGWAAAPIMQKDSEQYVAAARDLRDFHLEELHIRTLGYPLILLATGASEAPSRALYVVSLLFHGVSVWLLGVLLMRAGVPLFGTLIFGVTLWLPVFVEPAAFVMTENASQFTLILGLAGLVIGISRRHWGWLVAAGAALAFSGLIHPTFQVVALWLLGILVLLPWILPWARVRRSHLVQAGGIVLACFAIIVGGMLVINRIAFGFSGLTPFTGYALSTKTVRVVEQLPDEYKNVRAALVAARDADLVAPRSSHMAASYVWRVKDQISEITGLKDVALSKYLVKLNLRLIKEAPLSYLQEVFLACAALWAPTSGQGLATFGSGMFHAMWAGLDLLLIGLFVMTLMALTGLTVAARLHRFRGLRVFPWALHPGQVRWRTLGYVMGLSLVIYTTLIVSFFGPGITRYRAPVMPIVAFLVVLGIDHLWRLGRGAAVEGTARRRTKEI